MSDGILLIDKQIGLSSFDVIRKIRKITGQKKIGHSGTLDPLASGLLIICLGKYTKFCGYLTSSNKAYECEIYFGISTNTDDQEGEVLAQKSVEQLLQSDVVQALNSFTGLIKQSPPKFSAIKINGQRAYAKARDGEDFLIEPREVEIKKLEPLDINLPKLRLLVECSKGTYIRSLARDLGEKLGVGAHASEIRRIKSGNFMVEQAMNLEDLSLESLPKNLLKGREALSEMPQIELLESEVLELKDGKKVSASGRLPPGKIGVGFYQNEPIAVLLEVESYLKVVRGI